MPRPWISPTITPRRFKSSPPKPPRHFSRSSTPPAPRTDPARQTGHRKQKGAGVEQTPAPGLTVSNHPQECWPAHPSNHSFTPYVKDGTETNRQNFGEQEGGTRQNGPTHAAARIRGETRPSGFTHAMETTWECRARF